MEDGRMDGWTAEEAARARRRRGGKVMGGYTCFY